MGKFGKAGEFLLEMINAVRKVVGKGARVLKKTSRLFTSQGAGTDLIRTTILKIGKRVQIKSGHGFHRPHATGDFNKLLLTMDEIENGILDDLEARLAKGINIPISGSKGFNGPSEFFTKIEGVEVGYRIISLPDGSFSIGTYFPK